MQGHIFLCMIIFGSRSYYKHEHDGIYIAWRLYHDGTDEPVRKSNEFAILHQESFCTIASSLQSIFIQPFDVLIFRSTFYRCTYF